MGTRCKIGTIITIVFGVLFILYTIFSVVFAMGSIESVVESALIDEGYAYTAEELQAMLDLTTMIVVIITIGMVVLSLVPLIFSIIFLVTGRFRMATGILNILTVMLFNVVAFVGGILILIPDKE